MDVQIHDKVRRFLTRLGGHELSRVRHALLSLESNPYPQQAVRVKGLPKPAFRIRIGRYRALYYVRGNTVYVMMIDKRSRVYDR